ncbi:hypothetical protein MTO96_009221 [Rhipicephalus appendiculatus]
MEAAERRTVGSELRPPSSRLSGAEHRARSSSISHLQRSQSLIPQRRPSRTARERIVTNCLLYQNVGGTAAYDQAVRERETATGTSSGSSASILRFVVVAAVSVTLLLVASRAVE